MKLALSIVTFLTVVSASQLGWARKNGIAATGCDGCHGATGAIATVTANPASFMPGADVTLSVAISRMSGTTTVAGMYVARPEVGSVYAVAGEGLTLTNDGLTHSAPKAAQNGVVTFRFGYRAPASPGALNLDIFVLSANGDGRSSGDVAGNTAYRAVFGCTAREYFYDGDGDGFGRPDFPSVIGCDGQPPVNTSAVLGDCDDNDQAVFPGAPEICNTKDDDCDGQIDEGSTPTDLYPDEDGDGFYARNPSGPAVVGCGLRGYAPRGGDCAPKDPKIFPGATEVCNLLDDNCDGRVDERVRPQCGVGFCTRESFTCSVADCTPGTPSPETCNLLDDDCDGEVDEGDLCAAGQICVLGKCTAGGDTGTGGAGAAGNTAAGGSNGATNGGAGQGSGTQGGVSTRGGSAATGAASSAGGVVDVGGKAGTSGGAGSGTGASPASTAEEKSGCSFACARPNSRGISGALTALSLLLFARRQRRPRANKA